MERVKIDLASRSIRDLNWRNVVAWEGRKVGEVIADLTKALEEAGVPPHLRFYVRDYKYGVDGITGDVPWPCFPGKRCWPACYAVRGGSEGYYAHIDMTGHYTEDATGYPIYRSIPIAFVKCETWQEAYEIAVLSAQLLDATI